MKVLEEIYREASNKIYKYIYRLSGNSHTAEEVLQETFYRAIEYMVTSKEDINLSWFYTVSRNIYFDSLRRQKKLTMVETINVVDEDPASNPDGMLLKELEKQRVHDILEKMNETYKRILILREFNELSYDEIGKEMNFNSNQVKVTLHRARVMFKKIYERGDRI